MELKRLEIAQLERAQLTQAKRIVVKLGTRVLAMRNGRPDRRRISMLVDDIAGQYHRGAEIVVVTSGAIGMGMEALGWRKRPTELADLQMAAAVGQARLMALYQELFAAQGIVVGQVLLTHDDLHNRNRHLNARGTICNLLDHRIVPIVNENDVVSVDEIKVGDNDVLAALTSLLIDAEALVLLTSADGFRMPFGNRTKRVSYLEKVTRDTLSFAKGKGSTLSVGGMSTKLQAAQSANRGGVRVVIASGRKQWVLRAIFEGNDEGTLLGRESTAQRISEPRKRWLAFFHRPKGAITVDDGAARAIEQQGRSLLPIGIRAVKGTFPQGAIVNVQSEQGRVLARGVVGFSSTELGLIIGKRSREVSGVLGSVRAEEVVHRNNMVLLGEL